MANTKYTPCSNPNQGLAASALSLEVESVSYPIVYKGRGYRSLEAFDANNMPREIFATKPNFVAAFAGTKITGGIDTGEPCLVIGVHQKIGAAELAEEDQMPSVLPDGVITDIIEMPKFEAFPTCTDGSGDGCPPHDEKHRPLQGGTSAIEETGTACTLGLVVKDSTTGNLVALTNNHCVGLLYDTNYSVPTYGSSSVVGKNMLQPSPSDGGDVADLYGTVVRAVAMKFDAGQDNLVDCGISSIGVNDASTIIMDVNDGPYSFALTSEYTVGTELYKSGRTTGVTPPPDLTITNDDALVLISYGPGANDDAYFNHVIIYESSTRATQGGDSGAAMLALIGGSYKVASLNFAGNSLGTISVGCHIADVASELNIEAWDGNIVVAESASPVISVNGVCYERIGDTADSITHIAGDSYSTCLACEEVATESSSSTSSISQSSVSSSSESSLSSSSSPQSDSSSSTHLQSTSSSLSSSNSSSSSSESSSSESSSTHLMSTSSSTDVSFSSSSSEFEVVFREKIPQNLSFETQGQNEIALSWSAIAKADGYVVERKEGFSEWEEVSDVAVTSYTDSSLSPGKYYQYRVRGYINA